MNQRNSEKSSTSLSAAGGSDEIENLRVLCHSCNETAATGGRKAKGHPMRSQNDRATHHLALTIMCPSCYAAPGDPCFRRSATGHRIPLVGPPAHPKRMAKAERLHHLPFHEAKETEK